MTPSRTAIFTSPFRLRASFRQEIQRIAVVDGGWYIPPVFSVHVFTTLNVPLILFCLRSNLPLRAPPIISFLRKQRAGLFGLGTRSRSVSMGRLRVLGGDHQGRYVSAFSPREDYKRYLTVAAKLSRHHHDGQCVV